MIERDFNVAWQTDLEERITITENIRSKATGEVQTQKSLITFELKNNPEQVNPMFEFIFFF